MRPPQTLLVGGLLLTTAVSALAQSGDGSFSCYIRFLQTDGEVIYRTVCQGCHMPAGQGAVGAGSYPALTHDQNLAAAGYAVTKVMIGAKAMPPFASLLDDHQIAAVVNFVRTHFGNSYDDAVSANDAKDARLALAAASVRDAAACSGAAKERRK
jgi:hypothetical protein